MPRYFNGFVSRFSAGSQALYASDLSRLGLSAEGARAVVEGDPIASFADRRRLATIVVALLDLQGTITEGQLASLLPAVQAGLDVSGRARKLSQLGLSARGAYDVLSGHPVEDPGDRDELAGLLRKHHRPGSGGYNGITMNDSAGGQGYVKHSSASLAH
jgi:hypothetical protein